MGQKSISDTENTGISKQWDENPARSLSGGTPGHTGDGSVEGQEPMSLQLQAQPRAEELPATEIGDWTVTKVS